MDNALAKKTADTIRILAASMVEKAKSGHPGGAMGGADFMAVLYSEFLTFDSADMNWPLRDRFFLDPGHMSPMLYATLSLCGKYTMQELAAFRTWESPTPGHPEVDVSRGVENTSGPLGQGHAMALGAAIVERFLAARFGEQTAHKTYAYISDGGVQEEISQAVGRLAGHLGISNLIMFYDSNDIQLSTETREVTSEDTHKKYEAWGWHVETIDGNNIEQIRGALSRAQTQTAKPTLIIGKTIMGKGALTADGGSFERKVSTHGQPLSAAGASYDKTIAGLGGDPTNPFALFSDVAQGMKDAIASAATRAASRKANQKAWEANNAEKAAQLASFFSGKVPAIDYAAIAQKPHSATRAASGAVLATFATQVENMIVASADLCNSDNTESFLKKSKAFCRGDFSGNFLQVGVNELTMAAIANGMALHGGVIPVCATFFVFSDYMKPAVRMSALMELGVKFVWTHDAFRVGEDGPTHEPIEQEAQIRLLEKVKNFKGHRSMLVLRPGDAIETSVAWKLAMENTHAPTALILSRQPIVDIPVVKGPTRYDDALAAALGAYVAYGTSSKPDLIFVANGSEVSLGIEAAGKLSLKGLSIRVVSVPSEGLFVEQTKEYKESVIPFGVPAFGISAGLPVNLAGLVGPLGDSFGMTRFGASAPFKVLDEKFGFTVDNIVAKAEAYLISYKALVKKIASLA